ncbi:MAG: GYD domain-containing protein [Rhodospirillales bacterium]|nr:GYD domain-containing protein [Rhodospirillales bacterium]MDE2199608.1 GYD domain-containing protein [Rhodospirillales bacterium]MDE2576238.1 GYD domain-containing protein [Rhodospirillales bacterium]
MLFSFTGEYTAQALNAMASNPKTDREAAVKSMIEAAGGRLVSMYARAINGPGVMIIFDVPDPEMSAAISGVAVASGSIQNAHLTRLYTTAEMRAIRDKRIKLNAAYKPPGQQ